MNPRADQPSSSSRAEATRAVPAVTRAMAILRMLSRSETPLGVQAIARALGIVPSTCLHILRALVAEEMLMVDPATKRYALASGVVALARGMLRNDPFSNLAQPVLDRLAAEYGTTAIGVEAAGLDHIVVLAIARPSQALRLQVDVGSRYPALISATGRCVAAFGGHSWLEMERRFHTLRWEDPPSLDQWRADVHATQQSGYAVDEGRYIAGVTVIAAPVMLRGRVSHSIVVVGVSEQLRRQGLTDIGTVLRREAADLSQRLQDL
ncbi:IclR family transcriptional regulator [Teichococcus wenyumeiae]|nr:IclR family transcriptional regulator [Pseudoroseomonas wenyumeiae]